MLRYSIAALLLLSGAPAWASFPDGVLDERQCDFGVVPRGQQLVHYFRLVNNTEQPMHIYNVRVSCGCTTARALNATVAPGQESAIWANMDSRRFLGHKAVTIYVSFDQPRYEEIRLVVQAYSRDDIVFSPDGINLGKVHQGEAKTGSMNITFSNGQAQALEATAESSFLQPSLKEVKRSGAETTYQVITKIRPDTPAGVWFTDVWVKTSVPGAPKLRVPVTVEVDTVQPVQVQPAKEKANVKTSQAEPPLLEPGTTPTNSVTQPEPPAPPSESSVQPEPQSSRPSIFPTFVNFFRRN